MNSRCKTSQLTAALGSFLIHSPRESGNILVYVVVVMVIFALLGAVMVSLFSTSISSSATPNDTRRAFYNYESGVRYAASELINNAPDFSSTTINRLNSTTYKIDPAGSFKLKVCGLNFQSLSKLNPGTDLNLKLVKGLLPSGFTIPKTAPYISVVNYQADDLGNLSTDQESAIIDFTYQDATHVSLTLADDFVVGERETVAFAVRPSKDDSINQGGALLLTSNAAFLFPLKNGVIVVNGKPYFYDDRIDVYADNEVDHAELTNIRSDPKIANPFPLVVTAASTYVILSPAIYIITAEGKSGEVAYTEKWYNQYGGSVYDRQDALRVSPESRKPDIAFEEEAFLNTTVGGPNAPSNPTYITADNVDKRIVISGSSGFGATWFSDTRPIGGNRDFCLNDPGATPQGCFFKNGFRAFFILTYSSDTGNGDGLTFSVLNGSNNDNSSVGGDVDLSELLAYAGDSRTISSPSKSGDFLDGKGQGLRAPKMALEFDGKANNQKFSLCDSDTTVNTGTRNDPDFSGTDRDAVQYVFWGSDNSINAPCRVNPLTGTNKTYDDNRHDGVSEVWVFESNGARVSSPAISSDETAIYIGRSSNNTQLDAGRLISVNRLSGIQNWSKNPDRNLFTDDYPNNDDDVESSPVISAAGYIYIGSDSDQPGLDTGRVAKFSSGGTRLAQTVLDGDVKCTPAVSNAKVGLYDGNTRIYVTTTKGLLATLQGGNLAEAGTGGPTGLGSTPLSSPVIRYDTDAIKNYIYVGSASGTLYMVRDDGNTRAIERIFNTGSPIQTAPAVNPATTDIYFGSNNRIYARTKDLLQPKTGFPVITGGNVLSSPAVTTDGRTIYAGSDDGRLYKISVDAAGNLVQTEKYPPVGQASLGPIRGGPAIGSGGIVYFGSDDGHLYALSPDGTLKWKYPATGSIAKVRSKPAIDSNGIVYFGAEDGKLYAVEFSVNNPMNTPDLYLAPDKLGAGSGNNWLTDGPWAVRLEVQRIDLITKYGYTLKAWMKKCQDGDCTNVVDKFFQNTRFEYDWTTAGISPMTQTIELSKEDPDPFDRFLFGFTSATSAQQTSVISKFQLSFIRPGDPLVND
jgi:outer membrane protein assembly factor BamB